MSKASELEAARLAAERNDARCDELLANVFNHPDRPSGLEHLAKAMLTEATYISEQRKSGWKSRSDAHTAAGRILEQWARDLAAYLERDKPPMRPPLDTIKSPDRHAGLDPADGPISAQITSGLLAATGAVSPAAVDRIVHDIGVNESVPVSVPVGPASVEWPDGAITPDAATRVRLAIEAGASADDKLDAAFGPVDKPAPVHITAAPANYAWCDATSGTRGYVGTATCPDCIAAWNAHHGTVYSRESDRRVPTALASIEPTLEPFDDLLTRHDDGSMIGVVKCAIQPNAPAAVRIDIHGHAFMTDLPMPGRTGILAVTYRAYEGGQVEVLGTDFEVDPPMRFTEIADRETATPQFSEPGAPPPRQTQQRMTFDQVREHGMARARGADHRSYSQVQAFSECGIRYALSDLDVTPAWWNVGGTALHYACEHINYEAYQVQQTFGDGPQHVRTDHAIETLWTNCLNRSVSETITEHPTAGPDTWRAAKKGAEGYDWWRTNGVDMVRRWITRLTWLYDQGWSIATVDGEPAIELDCPIWIYEGANSIKVENIIDLVMVRGDTFLIVDAKSGASDPTSTYQLGQYGHALARTLLPNLPVGRLVGPILGAYWLARTDTFGPFDMPKLLDGADIRDVHPWSEIEYLITTMHRAESQGLYLPNKSKSDRFGCGSCGVAGLCPVGPR